MTRNAATLGLAQGAVLALNFALWVHLARALEADRLGMLAFGLALLSYFVLAVTLGFDAIGVRELAREPEREGALVADVLGVRLTLAVVAGAAFAAVAVALPLGPLYQAAVLVLGVQVVARAVQIDWVYQGREQMGAVAVRNVAASAVSVGLALALVRRPADVVWAAAALSAGPLVANAGLLVAYAREVGVPRPRLHRGLWPTLLLPALPLAASALVSQIYYNADKLMLEALRTTAEVGLYESAYKVYALAIAPAGVLYLAFFPVLSGALGDADAMRRTARAFASTLVALGPPFAFAGVVLAPAVVDLLFGAEYAAAVPALRILLVYSTVTYVSMGFGVPLLTWNEERAYLRAVVVGGVANVALNVALIAPLGTTGAALATLGSEVAVLLGMAFHFRRVTGAVHLAPLVRGVVLCVGGGVAPAWAASALGVPLVGGIPAVVLATFLGAWALGLVDPRAAVVAVVTR